MRDWDNAYANGAHIPDAEAFVPRWQADAAAFREGAFREGAGVEGAGGQLDIAYGAGPRERLDLFLPEGEPRGLCVFVHGGYWKAFDKSLWSHLAAGARARGWAVALPSYPLAPEARIAEITAAVARAITAAAELVPGPLRLAGHSAGGHLVARMACTQTPLPEAVAARVQHVLSISGVHDLRPLLATQMNAVLGLTLAEARAESPALAEPRPGTAATTWVGVDERPEFRRQSALIANAWAGFDTDLRLVEVPGHHHFDVIADLTSPESELTQAFVGA
ncbi:alpha/beta fold hydrolase [Frigidibacter albus]|uniref:Alpha/beta fold hydrolase n=1 Tax=Frigidibacter albus TaxID=1465486 RepID=A0A6L8VD82_9RHOB|nr:alpha/beta fold hydrolase [Frigidibacter albus]MZQ88213.1 alpha/beta fold hydrolase [Frigidibacter albus]NBE30113.1 alpha/beta fold hydrolase [Frigidibacter albus]GGH46773.1 esterase [Frigidibacter albus]